MNRKEKTVVSRRRGRNHAALTTITASVTVDLSEKIQALANRNFHGNRSMAVETAIERLLEAEDMQ